MAAVELTFSGVLYDKYNRTQQNVVLIGEASVTGVGVGGGPIIPPGQPPGGQPPGGGGIPTFPIAGYPDNPYPSQPIYRPGYPGGERPPSFPPSEKPPEPVEPPVEWKAIWAGPEQGWVVVGIPNVPHPTPSA